MFGPRCSNRELHPDEWRQPGLWRKQRLGWFVQLRRNYRVRWVAKFRRNYRIRWVAELRRNYRIRRVAKLGRNYRIRWVDWLWRIFRHRWVDWFRRIDQFRRDHDDHWRYDRHRWGYCWRDHGDCAHVHARRFTHHAADYGFLGNRTSRMAPTCWRWQVGNDWRPVRQHF